MTKQMMLALAVCAAVSAGPLHSQTTATPKPHKAHRKSRATTTAETQAQREQREIREMREQLQAQINDLKQQIADRDARLASATQTVQDTQAQAAAANAKAAEVSSSIAQEDERVKDLQGQLNTAVTTDAAAVKVVADDQKKLAAAVESPSTLHYKGVTFTPGGFAAAESVYRSRSINSDINTPFASTPYMNSAQAYTSEFNATARQSRLALLVNAPTPFGHMGAYYEMDFLSSGTTSNDNQTNSYTLRQREIWAQIATNSGFTLTAGQMWTLATEVKKGINPVPNGENLPQTIDPQYHVGFTFARQYGVRFAQTLGPKQNIAASIEESQTILAAVSNAPSNFFFGSAGVGGGLYNSTANYSNNVAPDILVKYTADPGYGHYEVGGVVRFFRDRYYPTLGYTTTVATSVAQGTGVNSTAVGGGFFANARFPVTHYLDIGLHVMQGTGTGRYGTSNLGDVTVKPSGALEPLRNSQGLLSLETHPTKKLDIFGYAGGEYLQRTVYTGFTNAAPTTPVLVGYGAVTAQNDSACYTELPPTATSGYAPGSATCTGATRAVIEGSAGFVYRIYSSPTRGRFQFSAVYSYLTREGWTGLDTHSPTGFTDPKATNNMVFTGFRYYIP
jgi:hypothetical protein